MFDGLGRQLRKPSGFFGRLVAKMMDNRNRRFYEKIINDLDLKSDDKIFEIGYGPGLGISLIANRISDCTIGGIDFSELMHKQATQRNQKFVDKGIVNLKFGNFLTSNIETTYDKVFCVNVIYFWSDLNVAFSKIFRMLNTGGRFCIFMNHKKDLEGLSFAKDFNIYSIEKVESALKAVGFASVDFVLDEGYFIKAIKR